MALEMDAADSLLNILRVAINIAAHHNQWPRVARLQGAVEAHRLHAGRTAPPNEVAVTEHLMTQACAALGADADRLARQAGAALTLHDAVAEASASPDPRTR